MKKTHKYIPFVTLIAALIVAAVLLISFPVLFISWMGSTCLILGLWQWRFKKLNKYDEQ